MRNIYLGDRGVLVQYLQLALTRAGYPVELDGIFVKFLFGFFQLPG